MTPREPRQTIRVSARMKSAQGWHDVAIQNASAHGMKISATATMRRGDCIEVRRGNQIIVARIVWAESGSYGLRTQDVVDIPALVNPNAAKAEAVINGHRVERRAHPRHNEIAEKSRAFATRFQWAAIGGALVMAAGFVGTTVLDVLSTPFVAVTAALAGTGAEAQAHSTN